MYDNILLFVFVINSGNFTKAAKSLHLTQSTVSRRIASLEDFLKVNLLRRNTRTIELTTEGEILYDRCKDTLFLLESAVNCIRPLRHEVGGKLIVSLFDPVCKKLVAPQLDQFLLANPHLELNIRYHDNQVINMFEEGFDLALVNYKPKQLNQKFRYLFKSKIILCATCDYLQKHGNPTFPASASQSENQHIYALLHQPERSMEASVTVYREINDQKTSCTINNRLVSSNYAQNLSMAESGNIIVAIPEYYVSDRLLAGSLIRILPEFHLGFDNYYLLRNSHLTDSKSNLFIKFLEAQIKLSNLI